jgi:hypothetical protein
VSANVESEAENSKTIMRPASTRGHTMMPPPPPGGNEGVSCWGWGPSQTVLHKSEESTSTSVLGNDDALSVLEELSIIDTKEVEGLDGGNAPNHNATQQPARYAADILRDHTEPVMSTSYGHTSDSQV